MKKYQLYISVVLIAIFSLFTFKMNACKKKRAKKKQLETQAASAIDTNIVLTPLPHDSIRVIRAPGVINPKQLDSLKKSQVKEPMQ